ncbi:MAG: ABC transporter permease, partial [Thermodesulfobacteriota bacterium]|nr:ABC transporter permease [Thermodesulfobacteriota bacterium]
LKYSVKALYYIMPNLEKFNIKSQVTHNIIVSHEYIMSTSLYALVYITLLLLFSVILFERRDFR